MWKSKESMVYLGKIWGAFSIVRKDFLGATGLIVLLMFIFVAGFAPYLAPFDPYQILYDSSGAVIRFHPPSRDFLLGTTQFGHDVFSQIIHGSRVTIIVGFLSALLIVLIGTNIGLIAGYYGGWIDAFLMRTTDVFYGIPFLPFAVVLISISRPSISMVILSMSLLMWRTSARVIRSQVLTLRERKFIQAAKSSGASNLRIIYLHIGPNILPMTFLYMAFGISWGILGEASLSFIGLGDPYLVSWGRMLNEAFTSGQMMRVWWWTIPPGLSISLIVVGCFMIGRAFEEITNPRLKRE